MVIDYIVLIQRIQHCFVGSTLRHEQNEARFLVGLQIRRPEDLPEVEGKCGGQDRNRDEQSYSKITRHI